MCLAFVTIKRDQVNYFDASIGSLLSGLDDKERRVFSLNVLFANTNPDVHPSWGQLWMDRLIDSVSSYNVSEKDFQRLRALEESHNWYEKGVHDYTYVLDQCYLTRAPYIGIFEDDIIFADGWLAKTLRALHDIEDQLKARNWLYLRLFYTETALSWTSDDFAYRHMSFIFLVAMIASCGALLLIRRTLPSTRRHLDIATITVICTITVPAFTGLVFMIGKYNITPMRGVVEMNKYGCCTQAMIFPRDQVPNLVNFLRDRNGGQTDSLIEEYADAEDLRRFALAPPQVQHVGIRSSRDNLEINTRTSPAAIPGYNIVDIEWEVQVTAGGPTVNVTGTVEEVYAHLKTINPDFETEFPPIDHKNSIEARAADYSVSSYFCQGRWAGCSWSRIQQGISYLDGVPGRPSNGPGPGNCGRVSCSYNSAIYWCNDKLTRRDWGVKNTYQYTLDGFYDIASGASFIGQTCLIGTDTTSGQVFYADNWNVIVRGDSC
ncbi:hypothetical protein TCE0_017r04105 [Talaromyces pinophilus]|uniref:Uncharacterized protein n=1 Tax=Talaromyces pinophilus TaxID=128442 RepID=A0A6V8H2T0_TALPI|nr:hypothetical protein TCE0_017r04105 [Talaromyces pinophilus]